MQVTYKGQMVEASELKTPDGSVVLGYQIGNEIVMPQMVQLPGGEPASVELPATHLKAKRGKDTTINP
ncbi:hypothetical protein [Stenomitos frigidus]|uniref:Uncharacterized protein n=1 Tax=Stenomitos frigidus ULC18 TaxID=2107698 RepID=A0A2T1EB04_9CYAN|nr:hypothetical protein [Stenomitos frigidus]PSB29894.1 hypothetical protein C7B82_10095 [Stenomitos frigidus ULC18]